MIERVVLFGDPGGAGTVLSVAPEKLVCGLVVASIRPEQHDAMRALGRQHGIPLLVQPRRQSKRMAAFEADIRALRPDLLLVNSYSMLLPEPILSIATVGGVNVHGGVLPEFRGCSPIQWALIRNEHVAGVTIHEMTAKFDEGQIIATERVPVRFDDTWVTVQQRVHEGTRRLLERELPRILARTHSRVPQDASRARYFRRRHPEDGRFEWSASVLAVYNLVRALVKPLPGAFFEGDGRKVVLDTYLPLADVARLKYSSRGGGYRIEAPGIELSILRPEDPEVLGRLLQPARASLPEGPTSTLRGDLQGWLMQHERESHSVWFHASSSGEGREALLWVDALDLEGRKAVVHVGPPHPLDLRPQERQAAVGAVVDFVARELELEGLVAPAS